MKKLLLLLITLTLFSCSKSKVNEVAAFELNGAWYWVAQYEDGATQKDVEEYVNKWANPNQTSHFFVYNQSIDLSVFKNEAFNLNKLTATVLANKPEYGYYKIPNDPKLHNDAVWLLEQVQKQ
ncbi:hypothetical protein ACSV4D_09405 [Flavobacterium sp. ARAG 55.4]|uniref:hypothetical protein n=1 Tax=Flavobacterium sp. ARAG 55.4 TaxID=3451357 RepID=UPI003F4557BF